MYGKDAFRATATYLVSSGKRQRADRHIVQNGMVQMNHRQRELARFGVYPYIYIYYHKREDGVITGYAYSSSSFPEWSDRIILHRGEFAPLVLMNGGKALIYSPRFAIEDYDWLAGISEAILNEYLEAIGIEP